MEIFGKVFRLEYPFILYFLLVIPFFLIFSYWGFRSKREALQKFGRGMIEFGSIPSLFNESSRWLFLSLAVAVAIVGFSNPQVGEDTFEVHREGIGFRFYVDTSISMNARDILPAQLPRLVPSFLRRTKEKDYSRLEAAKEEILAFLYTIPRGYRVGLGVFTSEARSLTGLTSDYGEMGATVEAVDLMLTALGTSFTPAILSIVDGFPEDSGLKVKVAIILSDGEKEGAEEEEEGLKEALELAKQEGIRIYTVGIGSTKLVNIPATLPSGKKIPLELLPVKYRSDLSIYKGNIAYKGEIQRTKLDEERLKRIARATGGEYYHYTERKQLLKIFEEIIEKEGERVKVKVKIWRDLWWYFVFTAVCLGMFYEVIERFRFFRIRK